MTTTAAAAAEAAHQKDITSWASKDGSFKRLPSTFRNSIQESGQYPPEKGRYMLYVSLACPWAASCLAVRILKGLESFVDVSVVHPHMGALGWSFYPPIRGENGEYPATTGETGPDDGIAGCIPDPLYDAKFVREIYFRAEKGYTGRFTVPILWDKKTHTIVNNESSEIIRMFNTQFNSQLPAKFASVDLYPEHLRSEIDELNTWVYDTVNNGVYKSGFASSQAAYESAVVPLFASLDRLEKILEKNKYIVGDQLTEADVRLYRTIVRFDPVYQYHFKCNLKGGIRQSYPALNHWVSRLYHTDPAFRDTTDFVHIKHHYFTSHPQINPTRVVPLGPIPAIQPLSETTGP